MKLFLLTNECGRYSGDFTEGEYERLLIIIEELRKLVSGKTVVVSGNTQCSRGQAMTIRRELDLDTDSIEIWEGLGFEDSIGKVPADIKATARLCSDSEQAGVDCLILATSDDLVKLAGRCSLWELKSFDAGIALYIGEGAERSFITPASS